MSTAAACIMVILVHIQNVTFSVSCYLRHFFLRIHILTSIFFNPLLQNVHFPYVKLSPTVQWQNLILHDLEILYDSNSEKIQAFIVLEKFAHICRLLYENMNHFPDHDKNTADLMSLTAMIGYVQKNYANKILLKNISSAGNCCKTKMHFTFPKNICPLRLCYT